MQLEQTLEMYRPTQMQMRRHTEQRQRTYTIVDLESLSAGALYMPGEIENGAMNWVGNIPILDKGNFKHSIFNRLDNSVDKYVQKVREESQIILNQMGYGKSVMGSSRPLDEKGIPLNEGYGILSGIRLPESGVELHIHEQPGGKAHIKYQDGKYTEINSYDAAMADKLAEEFDFKKFLSSCRLKLPETE